MTELIGIDRARILSVVFGGGAAVWAYFYAEPAFRYAAFFAAFLAFINLAEYRRSKMGASAPSAFDIEGPAPGHRPPSTGRSSGPGPAAPRRRSGRPTGPPPPRPTEAPVADLAGGVEPAAAEAFAWNLLRRGDGRGARRVLQRSSGPVGPFVEATVALATEGTVDPLADAYLANPAGPSNLVPAAVAADSGHVLTLAQRLVDAGPDGLAAAGSLQTHLHYGERFDHAAAVGELVYAGGGGGRAQTAFDIACSWSKAGEPERALDWVRRAIDDGFGASRLLDGEPDLAAARAHPDWKQVRDELI